MDNDVILRKAKIIFNKPGGTARGNNAITNRVTIPSIWIKDMDISSDERDVVLMYDKDKHTITIYKDDKSESNE
jgi:hypothetical protein